MAERVRSLGINEIKILLGLYFILIQFPSVLTVVAVYANETWNTHQVPELPNPKVAIYYPELPTPNATSTTLPTNTPTPIAELITTATPNVAPSLTPTSALTAMAAAEAARKVDPPPATPTPTKPATATSTPRPANFDNVVDLGNGIIFPFNFQKNCPVEPGKGIMACTTVVACNSPEGSDLSLACYADGEKKGLAVMAHNTNLSSLKNPGLPRLSNPGASLMASSGKILQLGHLGCYQIGEFGEFDKEKTWKLADDARLFTSSRIQKNVYMAMLESVSCN